MSVGATQPIASQHTKRSGGGRKPNSGTGLEHRAGMDTLRDAARMGAKLG